MSNEPTINLELLLAPIAGEDPAGANLLYAGLHDQIREARRSEEDLAQGDWEHSIKVADWRLVVKLAIDALAGKTKDLQVAAWLTEALVKLHGFPGLRDGFKLMRGLIEQFWDQVYPEIDDGDLDGRANALSFLDRQCAFAIREVPVTGSSIGRNLSFFQFEESKKFDIPERFEELSSSDQERIMALKEQAAQEGKITSEQWRAAKNSTKRAFCEQTAAHLKESMTEFKLLDQAMDEKFKNQTPGLGALRKALEEVWHVAEALVKEKRLQEPDAVQAKAGENIPTAYESVAEPEVAMTTGGTTGPVRSRKDALKRLAEVADYFRKTEPHSPVTYLVERAIRWGEMPLDLWLQDVVKDGSVLENLRETLGLKTAGSTE
jgi:type VI secretion system protein ImpA